MENLSVAAKIQANLQELFKANVATGDTYIRFQLTSEITALLSMETVQESLLVNTEQITPLPEIPESVIGVMSSRDRVFCVFDLAQILGFPSPLMASRQYQVIVLRTNSHQPSYFGLAVIQFQGMVRLAANQLQSSIETFPENLIPYLAGAVTQQETITPLLDIEKIVQGICQ